MASMELDSRALRAATAVHARSVWLGDHVVVDRPLMPVTARRFRFTSEVDAEPWEIEGYTSQQPPYRDPDLRTPTLHLDGQRFFDRAHTTEPIDVFALVGGPPSSPPELAGHFAHVLMGARQGEPVRPFALQGADRVLETAARNFAGFADRLTPELIQRIIDAGHPLIALDALQIAAAEPSAADQFGRLATYLLHPSETPEAKAITLQWIGRKLRSEAPGSAVANALMTLTWRAWQFERQHRVAEGYLEIWAGAPEQVGRYPMGREVIAMAVDETEADRMKKLRDALRQGGHDA